MDSLMTSVATAATWFGDTLDTLLDDALIGFGHAAPLVAEGEEDAIEDTAIQAR